MTAPAPVWVAPWDRPWVRAHRLTKPMFVALYGLGRGQRRIYPAGQNRLIMNALFVRGLIDGGELTACGHVLAIWAAVEIRRAYPGEIDQ